MPIIIIIIIKKKQKNLSILTKIGNEISQSKAINKILSSVPECFSNEK